VLLLIYRFKFHFTIAFFLVLGFRLQ